MTAAFVVTPERRRAARGARRTVLIMAGVLGILAIAGLVLFPPGAPSTRVTLTGASVVLLLLAAALAWRVLRIAKKADRWVAHDETVLALTPQGAVVAGDVRLPWEAISGVWAQDRGAALRARAERAVISLPGATMLRAGVSTGELLIGVADTGTIDDPHGRVHRFRALPSGRIPGRIELPLGAWFGSAELAAALDVCRENVAADVPVRPTEGVMGYAAAWAGSADEIAEIRRRESARPA